MGNQLPTIAVTAIDQKSASNSPRASRGFSVAVNHFNNSLIVYGGYPGTFENVYELSLRNYTWHEVKCGGIIPPPRFNHCAFVYHEKMYIFGGETQNGARMNDVHALNLETYDWEEVHCTGNGPSVRSGHSCVTYKNKAIIFGGERLSNSYLNDFYELNLDTFVWGPIKSNSKTVPTCRSAHTATVHGDEMIIFGGKTQKDVLNDCYKCNLDTYTWSKLEFGNKSVVPTPRKYSSSLCMSGVLMIFGGLNEQDKPLNDLHLLKLDDNSFIRVNFQTNYSNNQKEALQWSQTLRGSFLRCIEHQRRGIVIGGTLEGAPGITDVYDMDIDTFEKSMIVDFNELQFIEKISENEVREVYTGKWRGEPVAIKILKVSSYKPLDSVSSLVIPSISSTISSKTSLKVSRTNSMVLQRKPAEEVLSQYMAEVNVLRQMHHPNILGFKCVAIKGEKIAIVTEISEHGTVKQVVENTSKFSMDWEQKVMICLDVIRGINYLHSKDLVHGNITADCLLVMSDFHVKVYYGANSLDQKQHQDKSRIYRVPNLAYFLSPEALGGNPPKKSDDIYSFGILMWLLFTRKPLYGGTSEIITLTDKVKKDNVRPCSKQELEKLLNANSDEVYGNGEMIEQKKSFLKLMQRCWCEDPEDRPTCEKIIKSLKDCSTKISSLLGNKLALGSSASALESHDSKSQRYEKVKLIGRGGQAMVFLVNDRTLQQSFALKKFFSCKFDELNVVLQEMRVYTQLRHRCLVQVKDFFISEYDRENNCCFNLVMDYCDGGDLQSLIKLKKGQKSYVDERTIYQMSYQLAVGLAYLHGTQIIHRDIKPNNIFLMKSSSLVKIGDLGLAKQMTEDNEAKTFVGTINYMAPELRNQQAYSYNVDIWAFGCVVYELITLSPFDYSKYMINQKEYMSLAQYRHRFKNQNIFEIMERSLQIDPKKRPNAEEIISWFVQGSKNGELDEIMEEIHSATPLPSARRNSISPVVGKDDEKQAPSPKLQPLDLDSSPRMTSVTSIVKQRPPKPSPITTTSENYEFPEPTYSGTSLIAKRFAENESALQYSKILMWNTQQVVKFFETVFAFGGQYKEMIMEHEINGEALLELQSVQYMNYLGVKKLGHLTLILKYVKKLAAYANQETDEMENERETIE